MHWLVFTTKEKKYISFRKYNKAAKYLHSINNIVNGKSTQTYCSHVIFEEIWFVELNLSWCCIYVDFMRCGLISKIWSSNSLLVERVHLIWGNRARDALEVWVLEESFLGEFSSFWSENSILDLKSKFSNHHKWEELHYL